MEGPCGPLDRQNPKIELLRQPLTEIENHDPFAWKDTQNGTFH